MKYSKEEHFKVERVEERGNRKVRIGKFYCILNGKTYDTLGGLRNAIKPHMTMKEFYIEYYSSEEDFDVCVVCGKDHRIFIDVVEGFREYCSNTCSLKIDSHRAAVANRFVGDPNKKQQALAKRKQTYDNKSFDELNAIQEKRKSTLLANHGLDYFSEKAKNSGKDELQKIYRLCSLKEEKRCYNETRSVTIFMQQQIKK